ncbi:MAG: YbaB/EbfC family nucleoid-associated protein [Parcubacteria group bacterium]
MGFFDDVKDMHALKKQAETVQAQLESEVIEGVSNDGKYKIIMDGSQKVNEVVVPDDVAKEEAQKGIKEALEDARNKLEKLMRDKMMSGMMN